MSNLTDFIGSSEDKLDFSHSSIITESETWTVPETGKYLIILSGGGGSGASMANLYHGTGGNSGDVQTQILELTALEDVVITIGAGGASVAQNLNVDGNDGGVTSFGAYFSTSAVNNAGNGAVSQGNPISPNEGGVFLSYAVESYSGNPTYGSEVALSNNTSLNTETNEFIETSFSNGTTSRNNLPQCATGGAKSFWANGGTATNNTGGTAGAGKFSSGGGSATSNTGSGAGGDGLCIIRKVV